jgi:hypothetical protein
MLFINILEWYNKPSKNNIEEFQIYIIFHI